jgi:hypothetical protein
MHTGIISFIDVVFHSVEEAFEFFPDEDTLKATMKKKSQKPIGF